MSQKADINQAFRQLLVNQPVQPFHVADLFNYLADRQADSTLLANNATAEDEAFGGGLYTYASQDAADCKTAMDKLVEIKQAGTEIIYLDVTQKLPEQVIQGTYLTAPINKP